MKKMLFVPYSSPTMSIFGLGYLTMLIFDNEITPFKSLEGYTFDFHSGCNCENIYLQFHSIFHRVRLLLPLCRLKSHATFHSQNHIQAHTGSWKRLLKKP